MIGSRVVSFSDPLQCHAAIQSTLEAEILPVARGHFRLEATQVGMEKLRMQRLKIALPQIDTLEVEPDRKAIGFVLEESSSGLLHRGRNIEPGDIVIYGSTVLHDRSGANFHYGTMSIPSQTFSVLCKSIMGREFLERSLMSLVRPDRALLSRLLELHRVVGQLAHGTPDLLELPEIRRALEEQLVHAMIRCLADGTGVETSDRERRFSAIITKFEEFLDANPGRPFYLTEICAALGAPERTLRYACEEHFGMGPVRFLALRRMHLVRRALMAADHTETTVTHIATDHGFWELGRFATTYRTLFGETPSQTLRQPPKPGLHFNRPSSLPVSRPSH